MPLPQFLDLFICFSFGAGPCLWNPFIFPFLDETAAAAEKEVDEISESETLSECDENKRD